MWYSKAFLESAPNVETYSKGHRTIWQKWKPKGIL